MRVSVVLNACKTTAGLPRTLLGLRSQTYRRFEVVVICGPSSENLEPTLAPFGGAVKLGRCPDANLSRARNDGIALASGELVAFLDGGAVPEPRWLEELLAGYDSDQVAGVGGLVLDAAGQVPRAIGTAPVCDRLGRPDHDAQPPFWGHALPHADPIAQLPVTNASFRRRCLEAVGGFDEDIEDCLEGTDLCLRLIDRGYRLRLVRGAVVHHPAPPDRPGDAAAGTTSFLKNRACFALRWHPPEVPAQALVDEYSRLADQLVGEAHDRHAVGALSAEELAAFEEEVDRALWLGIAHGSHGGGRRAALPPAHTERFRPFPTLTPQPHPLTLCLVSQEMPPEDGDEAGRFIWELARGLAARGHEVHFLTRAAEDYRIEFEDGVWVHRVAPVADGPHWSTPGLLPAVKANLAHAVAVHREVIRLRMSRLVDLVCVPLRDAEGLYCLLDDDLVCALLLPPVVAPPPGMPALAEQSQRRALEQLALRSARTLFAVSRSALDHVSLVHGPPPAVDVFIVPACGAGEELCAERVVDEAQRIYAEIVQRGRFAGEAVARPAREGRRAVPEVMQRGRAA